ncbi:MAG TPA: hypothetical protein VF407_17460, partial [Polyangiaceae bacterium]
IVRIVALLGLFALVARRIKQRKAAMRKGAGVVLGALFAGTGLLPFAPALGLTSRAGALRNVIELAMRPFGEWDVVLGAGWHHYLLLASALPTFAGLALLFSVKKVRGVLGGFALGAGALLAQIAWSADVSFVTGSSLLLRLFCLANLAVCVWIARISLDETARA